MTDTNDTFEMTLFQMMLEAQGPYVLIQGNVIREDEDSDQYDLELRVTANRDAEPRAIRAILLMMAANVLREMGDEKLAQLVIDAGDSL